MPERGILSSHVEFWENYHICKSGQPQSLAHMFPKDIEIWQRFLAKHEPEYKGFIYDCKVGSGSEPVDELTEPYITMQGTLSKYRIDVIGLKQKRVELFEVKPNAATSAIGQITSYMHLLQRDYDIKDTIVGALVTDFERPDVRQLCSQFGLKYYVV